MTKLVDRSICKLFGEDKHMLIQRRIPKQYQGLDELCAFIQKGDLRYFNLETTINRGELWGNQYSGGSWLRADEKVLEDAKRIGFNMLSFANNHTLDFSHWGLLKTIEALEAHDIPHAGAGRNLAEAAAPAYLDTGKGDLLLFRPAHPLNLLLLSAVSGEDRVRQRKDEK